MLTQFIFYKPNYFVQSVSNFYRLDSILQTELLFLTNKLFFLQTQSFIIFKLKYCFCFITNFFFYDLSFLQTHLLQAQ